MFLDLSTGGAHSNWYDIAALVLSGWLIPFAGQWYRDWRRDVQRVQEREDADRALALARKEADDKLQHAREEMTLKLQAERAQMAREAEVDRQRTARESEIDRQRRATEIKNHVDQQASVTRVQMTEQIGENTKISTDAFRESNNVNQKFITVTDQMIAMGRQLERLQHQVTGLVDQVSDQVAGQVADKVAAKVVETVSEVTKSNEKPS